MWRELGRIGCGVAAVAALAAACGQSTRSASTPESGGAGGATVTPSLGGLPTLAGATAGGAPPHFSCLSSGLPQAPLQRLSVPDIDRTLLAWFGPGPTLEQRLGWHEPPYYRSLSAAFVNALRAVAVARAQSAVADDDTFELCGDQVVTDVNCAEKWLRDWGEKLYRRPLTDEQVEAYVAQFRSVAGRESDAAAARNALVSMILSPYFVLRVELGQDPTSAELAPEELAARLSHFTTRSAPDDALRLAAQAGELATPEGLLAHYQRLLQTPEGKSARELLVLEWFGLDGESANPGIDDELSADMTLEARGLVSDVFDEHGGTLDALLTTTHRSLNQRLSEHYGLPALSGDAWTRVDFAPPAYAAGLLSSGAFLTRYTRPSRRGVHLQEALRNTKIPSPPPGPHDTFQLGPGATGRERIGSALMGDPRCVSCHQLFDPLGFPLEAFDDRGRVTSFDTTASVMLGVGEVAVENPADLGRALARDDLTQTTAVRRYVELALDRRLTDELSQGPTTPAPPPPPAPLPIPRPEPDLELLGCVKGLGMSGLDLDLNRVASAIVTSQMFRQRDLPLRHVVAFDVSTDPLEHARREAATFSEVFVAGNDSIVLATYREALLEASRQEAPDAAGGAGGEGSGGAASTSAGAPTGGAP